MQPFTDVQALAESTDERLVGRRVNLQNARVTSTVPSGGFWISGSGDERLFVLPSEKKQVSQAGTVSITGVVLELPSGMSDRLGDHGMARDEDIYVFATQVSQK